MKNYVCVNFIMQGDLAITVSILSAIGLVFLAYKQETDRSNMQRTIDDYGRRLGTLETTSTTSTAALSSICTTVGIIQ